MSSSSIQRWPAGHADDAVLCCDAFGFDPPIYRAPDHFDDAAHEKVASIDLSCTLLRTYLSKHQRQDLRTLHFAGPSWSDFCNAYLKQSGNSVRFHALGAFDKAGSLLNWDEKLLLMRMHRLVLNGHSLKRLENLDKFQSLMTLRCSQNMLMSASLSLTRLQILDLSHNNLRSLKLDRLPALRVLHLQHNRITSPVREHVNFGSCKLLERLDLSYNLLDWDADSDDIMRMAARLPQLHSLSLSGNKSYPSQREYASLLRPSLKNQHKFPSLQFLDEHTIHSDEKFALARQKTMQKLEAFCKLRLCSMVVPDIVVPAGNIAYPTANQARSVHMCSLTICLEQQGDAHLIDDGTADLGFGSLVKYQRPQKIAGKRGRGSPFYFVTDQQSDSRETQIQTNDRYEVTGFLNPGWGASIEMQAAQQCLNSCCVV